MDGSTVTAYLLVPPANWMMEMADLEFDGDVEISNTAFNMISTMQGSDRSRLADTIAQVIEDAKDKSNLKRLKDYPDVFVARGQGLRIIFKMTDDKLYVTTVAKEE